MNFRQNDSIFFYIFIIVFCSSCFEIIEDVSFKKNGSGTFKYIVNLSQSKAEINSLIKLDSSSGFKIPKIKELNENINKVEQSVKNTQGISNVKVNKDYTKWIFEIVFDFENCTIIETAINNAINAVSNKNSFNVKDLFRFAGVSMQRNMLSLSKQDVKNANKGVLKKILSNANYTTIYRFETAIESHTNKKAKLSSSKKALMLNCKILNIINGKESLINFIKLVK
ncbi:MAG: hypothetical protein HUU47_01750 [Bacteroidetes bacterium]|nr:hypothetical protein [Bacteroidota bacterium]